MLTQEISHIGFIECFNYFVTALSYSLTPKFRKQTKLPEMFVAVESALVNDDLSEEVKNFAHQLKTREAEIPDNWALNAHLDQ